MVTVAADVAGAVRLGVLRVERLTVTATADAQGALTAVDAPQETPVLARRIAHVRAMYRQFGVDPTKTRPSSEALLRRLRRGLPFPRINTLVDVCNACSLQSQLPFGLYDLAHVCGSVELRRGWPGEEYEGIRKGVVHVEGRLVLCDDRGPFGNPTSDSARTMVTDRTTSALVVIYTPAPLPAAQLTDVLAETAAAVRTAVGGDEVARCVIPEGSS